MLKYHDHSVRVYASSILFKIYKKVNRIINIFCVYLDQREWCIYKCRIIVTFSDLVYTKKLRNLKIGVIIYNFMKSQAMFSFFIALLSSDVFSDQSKRQVYLRNKINNYTQPLPYMKSAKFYIMTSSSCDNSNHQQVTVIATEPIFIVILITCVCFVELIMRRWNLSTEIFSPKTTHLWWINSNRMPLCQMFKA